MQVLEEGIWLKYKCWRENIAGIGTGATLDNTGVSRGYRGASIRCHLYAMYLLQVADYRLQLNIVVHISWRGGAATIAKGCRVHYIHSVKRVSKRVNKGNHLAHKAFTNCLQNS